MAVIGVSPSLLKATKAREYAVRFFFGGACTVLAGLIAKEFGPTVGGLFLAFPAIFPASATLIESHEKRRKAHIGADGSNRGRLAASIDSVGTSLGCIGLLGFAFVLWRELPHHKPVATISMAVVVWGGLAFLTWMLRRSLRHHRIAKGNPPS